MIQRTILGCINQDYPLDKLEVIVIDDYSNDNSFEKIKEIVEELKIREQRYDIENRLHYMRQKKNAGKREAMAVGACGPTTKILMSLLTPTVFLSLRHSQSGPAVQR